MFAGLLPQSSICSSCQRDRSDQQGVITDAGIITCQDCLLGIPPPRIPTIIGFHTHPGSTPKYLTYQTDDRGTVSVLCGYCGESVLLSASRRIDVGKIIKTTKTIKASEFDATKHTIVAIGEDPIIKELVVEFYAPRIWKADVCADCAARYDDEVIHAGRINPKTGKPNASVFLRM